MTTDQLREYYLTWLEPQLLDDRGRNSKAYRDIIVVMFQTEFTWSLSMDENRVKDGMDLRAEYSHVGNVDRNALFNLGPPSFLEVLIGLSRRLSFSAGGTAPGWAWQLLCNLELDRMPDPLSRYKHEKAQRIIHTVIERSYNTDGMGGFFPLAWPDEDQTKVELWYQMHAYISELHPEH